MFNFCRPVFFCVKAEFYHHDNRTVDPQKMKSMWLKFLNDWYINIVLFFICILLIVQSAGYPETARTFPRLILVFLLLLVSMDTVFKIMAMKNRPAPPGDRSGDSDGLDALAEKPPDTGKGSLARYFYILVTIVLMFVFLLLVHLVGFIPAALIYIPLAARILGYRNLRNLLISSVGITCFMYLIFIVIMKSNLPQGVIIELVLR